MKAFTAAGILLSTQLVAAWQSSDTHWEAVGHIQSVQAKLLKGINEFARSEALSQAGRRLVDQFSTNGYCKWDGSACSGNPQWRTNALPKVDPNKKGIYWIIEQNLKCLEKTTQSVCTGDCEWDEGPKECLYTVKELDKIQFFDDAFDLDKCGAFGKMVHMSSSCWHKPAAQCPEATATNNGICKKMALPQESGGLCKYPTTESEISCEPYYVGIMKNMCPGGMQSIENCVDAEEKSTGQITGVPAENQTKLIERITAVKTCATTKLGEVCPEMVTFVQTEASKLYCPLFDSTNCDAAAGDAIGLQCKKDSSNPPKCVFDEDKTFDSFSNTGCVLNDIIKKTETCRAKTSDQACTDDASCTVIDRKECVYIDAAPVQVKGCGIKDEVVMMDTLKLSYAANQVDTKTLFSFLAQQDVCRHTQAQNNVTCLEQHVPAFPDAVPTLAPTLAPNTFSSLKEPALKGATQIKVMDSTAFAVGTKVSITSPTGTPPAETNEVTGLATPVRLLDADSGNLLGRRLPTAPNTASPLNLANPLGASFPAGSTVTAISSPTTTSTITPWDSSASADTNSLGSSSSAMTGSLNTGSSASDFSNSANENSFGYTGSGSSGSYLQLWQWAILEILCCCCCIGAIAAALMQKPKPKKKKAPPPAPAPEEPLPELAPLVVPTYQMPVTTSYAAQYPATTAMPAAYPYAMAPQSVI